MNDDRGTLKKIIPYGRHILIEVLPFKTKFGVIEIEQDKTRLLICKMLKVGPDSPQALIDWEGKNVLVSSFHGIPIDFPEASLTKEKFKIIVPDEVVSFWAGDD